MGKLLLKEKFTLGVLILSTLSGLTFIILLSLKLNYTVTAPQGKKPTFTPVPNSTCACDMTTACVNPVSINCSGAGLGLYILSFISLFLCIGAAYIFGNNIPSPQNPKTKADKSVLWLSIISALSHLIVLILLAVKLPYSMTSAQGKRPVFEQNYYDPGVADVKAVAINYTKGGMGLYTLATIAFTLSFSAANLIVEKRNY